MISPEYCRRFARYNRWQNEAMYASAAQLPDGTRKRNMGAFFKSIHGTLNHLMVGDWVWMSRFDGEPNQVSALDQELYNDFDHLREQRVRTDDRIDRFVATLTAERLAGDLKFRRTSGNREEMTLPLALAVLHLFNHQTHHRGQVSTLLMQCGVNVGVTDMHVLPADFVSPVFGT